MGILVDLAIIGIIALCIFLGYKKGLIKASIRILAFVIAILIALILYRPLASAIINNTNIAESIQGSIVNNILPEGASPDDTVQVDSGILNIIGGAIDDVAGTTVNAIAEILTVQIIELGALLLIFIIVKIILRFVTVFGDIIGKIPVLKQFNEVRWNYIWFNTRYSSCIYHTCSNIFTRTNDK